MMNVLNKGLPMVKSVAEIVALVFYFVAWVTGVAPFDNVWVAISAIAALVWAVCVAIPVLNDQRTRA